MIKSLLMLHCLQLLGFCISPCLASSVLWAITGVDECNATCGLSAARRLQFGCFAVDSSAVVVLPQTSPVLFAAKSSESQLPDISCSRVPLPKTRTVECPALPADCTDPTPALPPQAGRDSNYKWRWDFNAPIRCSAKCNHIGALSVAIDCVERSTGAIAKPHLCELVSTKPHLPVPCYNFHACSPVWKAGPWGPCSRDCGLGEIDRKVDCYQLVDSRDGPFYQEKKGQCSQSDEMPHHREYCVVERTCQPYYKINPGKCRLHYSASGADHRLCNETGLIRNSPQCVQLTADLRARSNDTLEVNPALCRQLGLSKPPPFAKCQVDAETLKQRRIKCINPQVAREPQFTLVTNVLVQMERRESLEVNCGQSATVIPGTQVRLHCKVANFKATDLKWKRPGSGPAIGGAVGAESPPCKRVCVVDGDLVIAKFKPKDSGLYEVSAGDKNATLSLHSHTAYEAYIQAYLPRMLLLHPNSKVRQQTRFVQLDTPTRDTLMWMPGVWTACSVPCGGPGVKTRPVHCEQLQATAYAIVNDSICQDQLGDRPATSESCGSHTCPVWETGTWDKECTQQHCYTPGYSLRTRAVRCVNQDKQPLPDAMCGHQKKPETLVECLNSGCQPEWKAAAWSPCSVSCGAYGFSSRQISCVWRGSGRPGGFACEKAGLELPRSFKACYNGACESLGCLDLSPVCRIYQASALCAHPSLRRNCCKTCSEYQLHVYNSLATSVVAKTAA